MAVGASVAAALPPLLLVAGTLGGFPRPLMLAVALGAVPGDQRRTAAALYRVAFNAGSIIGPPLGALAAAWNFGAVFVTDAVSSLVLAVVVVRCAPPDRPRERRPDRRPESVLRTLRRRPLALAVLLTVVAVDTSYRQLYVGLPLELHRLHAPTIVYGLTVTANCVIIVLAEVWMALRLAGHAPGRVIALGYEARYQSLYAGASISGTVIAPPIGGALFGAHPLVLWLGSGLLPVAAAAVLLAPRLGAGERVPAEPPFAAVPEQP